MTRLFSRSVELSCDECDRRETPCGHFHVSASDVGPCGLYQSLLKSGTKQARIILTTCHTWLVRGALRDRRLQIPVQNKLCLGRRGDPPFWPVQRQMAPGTAIKPWSVCVEPHYYPTSEFRLLLGLSPKGERYTAEPLDEPSW